MNKKELCIENLGLKDDITLVTGPGPIRAHFHSPDAERDSRGGGRHRHQRQHGQIPREAHRRRRRRYAR